VAGPASLIVAENQEQTVVKQFCETGGEF